MLQGAKMSNALLTPHRIAWTEKTWNPIRGCSKVSAGCAHCYAEVMAARFSGPGLAYERSGSRWSLDR